MTTLSRVVRRTLRQPLTIGLRREDPSRIWERRTPLTPEAVNQLVSEKRVNVHIEHCDRRVFSDEEYVKAGATIQPDLSAAQIILGIKEPPLNSLILSPAPCPTSQHDRARTYMMFSHTAKGQAYNMPLLSSFLADHDAAEAETLPRVIDFELLTSEAGGKRTVGFGWFAGVAGVLESLAAMAHAHLEIGVASPFLYTPRPHTLPSLDQLRTALRSIGAKIASEGTPAKLGPFVIGLTGTGNVAEGCLSILSELPIVKVNVKDLGALVKNESTDRRKVYLVHALPSDYLVRTDGRNKYSREDYYANPHLYKSSFANDIAPYLTLFLNGAGWAPSYPRLMTNDQLTVALSRAQELGGARFTNIGDISCDPEGGLEFLTHSTTLSTPFAQYRPPTLPPDLPSVQIMAVDILPSSIPLDASRHFSNALYPYLDSLIDSYVHGPEASTNQLYGQALERATIATGGKLSGKHEWLMEGVSAWRATQQALKQETISDTQVPWSNDIFVPGEHAQEASHGVLKRKRVLMLGSGMVAGPAVEKIAERSDVELLIASNSRLEMEKLSSRHNNVQYREIDVSDRASVSQLVQDADVVISLLPVALHTTAAELCIEHRKHLVTASYISDAMKALHTQALEADVLILNEIGLDPGIDHCSAISLLSRLQSQNKKIVSFISFCGGLPSPDVGSNMGPLGYKFSWSPKGVLMAALNSARYKLRHEEIKVPGPQLLRSYMPDVGISKDFNLEGIPNRDSLPYASTYDLGPVSDIRTLLRGTLRYPGFSEMMQFFIEIGLLEAAQAVKTLSSWQNLARESQNLRVLLHPNLPVTSLSSCPMQHQEALLWLLSSPTPPLPTTLTTPLDLFTTLLAFKLQYAPSEKDMVVMSHEIIAKPLSGPEEVYTSSLITYGTDSHSAMARTVGLPVALAALEVLDGKVAIRGVSGPGDSSIREPVLRGLEEVGLGMDESHGRVDTSRSIEANLRPRVFVDL